MKRNQDSFARFIAVSTAFHVGVLLLLTIKILIFPSEIPISQQSVQIDVVALPDKDQPAKPTVKASPAPAVKEKEVAKPAPPKPEPKPKKVPKVEPKKVFSEKVKPAPKKEDIKSEQNSAIDRIRAKQKIKERLEAMEAAEKTVTELKGNALSKGSALSGTEELYHRSYLDDLYEHIRNHWNLPEWLANGNYKASVVLRIDKRGNILNKKFVSSSGNDLFDQQVMSTLDKANPLPTPPSDLADYYSNTGIEVRFPE